MGLFQEPKYPAGAYQERLAAISGGHLEPESNARIQGGVYDSLTIRPQVEGVRLVDVIVLGEIRVDGLGTSGDMYVPSDHTVQRHFIATTFNSVALRRKSWFVLAKMAHQTPDEED